MNIPYIIIFVLILFVLVKQFCYIKAVVIFTHKTAMDYVLVTLGIFVFSLIAYLYGNSFFDYLLAAIGILTLLASWLKQGLLKDGFILQFRGKERYTWDEISKVTINTANRINVTFYNKTNAKITTQIYSEKNQDEILHIIESNVRNVSILSD